MGAPKAMKGTLGTAASTSSTPGSASSATTGKSGIALPALAPDPDQNVYPIQEMFRRVAERFV